MVAAVGGNTVCGAEHLAQSIQDHNPFFHLSRDTGQDP